MAAWYVSSPGWTAVTAWAALTAYNVGDIRRQLAAVAVGNERVWRCTTAGTSLAAEPSWTLTAGSTTTEAAGPVWTEITGNSTYAWTAPHARLASAFASGWGAAGDDFYISHQSAETKAATGTLTSPGTAASPCRILCVNDAGSTPPVSADLATTATITTTGANFFAFVGFAYVYGVTFNGGSGGSGGTNTFSSTTPWWWRLEKCRLKTVQNTAGLRWTFGADSGQSEDDQLLELINTSIFHGAVGQTIAVRCPFKWSGTASAIAGSVPTVLFQGGTGASGWADIRGVDLSALGTGTSLVDISVASFTSFYFEDCELGSSVSITTGNGPGQGGVQVEMVNCDSANTNYNYYKKNYQGTITQETTIVRTGGANDGTTTVSRKMVSTANSKLYSPLESTWIEYWNQTTGSSVTLTIECVTDNVTLTDADAWIEVEYLGTSGFPLGVYASDRAADVLAAAANQTSSSVAWTTTGLATPVKQSLSVSVTPQVKGMIRARVCLAKASTTMYFDPLILASSGRQFMLGESGYMNQEASGPVGRATVIQNIGTY